MNGHIPYDAVPAALQKMVAREMEQHTFGDDTFSIATLVQVAVEAGIDRLVAEQVACEVAGQRLKEGKIERYLHSLMPVVMEVIASRDLIIDCTAKLHDVARGRIINYKAEFTEHPRPNSHDPAVALKVYCKEGDRPILGFLAAEVFAYDKAKDVRSRWQKFYGAEIPQVAIVSKGMQLQFAHSGGHSDSEFCSLPEFIRTQLHRGSGCEEKKSALNYLPTALRTMLHRERAEEL